MMERVKEVLASYAEMYDLPSPVHQEVRSAFLKAMAALEK